MRNAVSFFLSLPLEQLLGEKEEGEKKTFFSSPSRLLSRLFFLQQQVFMQRALVQKLFPLPFPSCAAGELVCTLVYHTLPLHTYILGLPCSGITQNLTRPPQKPEGEKNHLV